MTEEERKAHIRKQNYEAVRRREARKKAAKLGLEGPPKLTRDRPADEAGRRAWHAQDEKARRKRLPEVYAEYERKRVRPDDYREKAKQFYLNNKERRIRKTSDWARRNPDKVAKYSLISYTNRKAREEADPALKEARTQKRRLLDSLRLKTNHTHRVKVNLRGALRQALRLHGDGRKTQSVVSLIGCSMSQLTSHLEKQFTPRMRWDNHGPRGWHIDHIIPCAAFDLSDPAQQRACFHFTNLRPLWAAENQRKSAKRTLLL